MPEALASFLESPPEVTNLMPAMTINITEREAAILTRIKRMSLANLPIPVVPG